MKKSLFVLLAAISPALSWSQNDPVSWKAEYKPTGDKSGEIVITGIIQPGWHTYSQRPTDAGPIPTSFTFTPMKQYRLEGKTEEADAHEEFVPAFEAKIFVFTGKAGFTQKIALTGAKGFVIPVKVEFMSCNDMMCLPPKTVELTVKVQ